eukprot:s85_g12.t4
MACEEGSSPYTCEGLHGEGKKKGWKFIRSEESNMRGKCCLVTDSQVWLSCETGLTSFDCEGSNDFYEDSFKYIGDYKCCTPKSLECKEGSDPYSCEGLYGEHEKEGLLLRGHFQVEGFTAERGDAFETSRQREVYESLQLNALFCADLFGKDASLEFVSSTSWPNRLLDLEVHLRSSVHPAVTKRLSARLPPGMEGLDAVEEGRSVKAFADPPRPVEGRKLRILCLHGTASTEKVLRAQLAPLIKRASEAWPKKSLASSLDDIEFVLQDGCVDCDLRNPIVAKQVELMKQYFPEEKFKQWAEPLGEETGWRRYGGWERAIEFAQEAMTKHAPIDGLLGFSQGSNLSHPLGAQAALGQGHPLHCVVHFCTTKPGWVGQTPDLFEYQLPLPALIIEGKVDETAKGSDEVASTYEHPVRLSHSDGHRPFPKKPDEAKKLAEDIHSFVVKSCRGTQL